MQPYDSNNIYIYICVCVCIYINKIYTYIHTCIYIYILIHYQPRIDKPLVPIWGVTCIKGHPIGGIHIHKLRL